MEGRVICGEDKFGRFIFFDGIHPTGRVHMIVGKTSFVVVRKALHRHSGITTIRWHGRSGN